MKQTSPDQARNGYENHLHFDEPRWFAIYTRYKREKLVKKHLEEKGIHTYLPLRRYQRRHTRTRREVYIPIISCYVFVKIIHKEYVPVLETEHVVDFVRFSRNLISIPEEEITVLRRVIDEGIDIRIERNGLQPGDPVEISGGPLAGLSGKLLKRYSEKNFLIELENIGYSLQMQVDPAFLRKASRTGMQNDR
jgi:transcriptional antiterminator RfaH